jgi:hypothetical protein
MRMAERMAIVVSVHLRIARSDHDMLREYWTFGAPIMGIPKAVPTSIAKTIHGARYGNLCVRGLARQLDLGSPDTRVSWGRSIPSFKQVSEFTLASNVRCEPLLADQIERIGANVLHDEKTAK